MAANGSNAFIRDQPGVTTDPALPVIRVFISSTYLDNVERRRLVENAVLQAGMQPVGMERFTASAWTSVAECERLAGECDVFVLIVAHRYGWIPDGRLHSITELEYEAAKAAGRPRLVFLLSKAVPVFPDRDFDAGAQCWQKQELLAAFKTKCQDDQMSAMFEDNTLQAKVYQALHQWSTAQAPRPAPRTPSQHAPQLSANELDRYLKRAEQTHESVPLAGFATRMRVKLGLEELYVPLHARVDLRGTGDAKFADALDAEARLGVHSHEIALVNAFREAGARRCRAVVILGDPGSGKTTQLKRLLLSCVRQGTAELGLAPDTVPVFLPLRELRGERELSRFIERMCGEQTEPMQAGFGDRLLARGRLLLLFDGLDEVADDSERASVARFIEQATRVHFDCRVVVSCRFAGYGGASRLNEDFLELHLRPLSAGQSEAYIRNWYREVESQLHPAGREAGELKGKKQAEELIERLRAPDFRAERIVTMLRNPLLLANLCLVHRDRGTLPAGRARLYGECVDVLLEHWRSHKGLLVEINAEAGRRALQPVALFLHGETGRTRASEDELVPVLTPALATVKYPDGARDFLRTIRDQSGLLTGWSHNQYGFMHLGFQEYLAAWELRRRVYEGDKGVLAELADHYGESWWQEVILILVATSNPSLFTPLMREVVKTNAFAEQPSLLGLLCEDAAEVSSEPFEELLTAEDTADAASRPRLLVAAQVLAQRFADVFERLQPILAMHPSAELRRWIAGRGAAAQSAQAQERIVAEGAGCELTLIHGGTFLMGSPDEEDGRFDNEGPQHEVSVTSFYLGRYPVTNEEYSRFLQANPDVPEPDFWAERRYNQARQPVVGVSWEDAARFAAWTGCRLPTEAEWEYACRAGTTQSRYGELDAIAWYDENSQGAPQPVGMKQPNPWGLHDMLGNVWEWCSDWYRPFSAAPVCDPSGPPMGSERVLRGGSWGHGARFVRAANRNCNDPDIRLDYIGFRLARAQERAVAPASDPIRLATVGRAPGGKKEMGPGVLVAGVDAPANARRAPASRQPR